MDHLVNLVMAGRILCDGELAVYMETTLGEDKKNPE